MHDDATIGQLALALARESELQALLSCVTDWICRAFETPDCVIYLTDSVGDDVCLVQSAAWGLKRRGLCGVDDPLRLRAGEGIVGAAAQSVESQVVSDTRLDPRHIGDVGSGRSELAVPVVVHGEVIGVIDTEHPEPGHYGDGERVLLEQVSALLGGHLKAAMAASSLQASLAFQAERSSRLHAIAMADPLTGLSNRRALDRRLNDAQIDQFPVWACVFDLDGFKAVNDSHGHPAGDEVLCRIAAMLRAGLGDDRNAVIARPGGDEFVVLSSLDFPLLEGALRRVLDEISFACADLGHITASIGVASGCDRAVISRADDALAVAKELGGNRIVEYGQVPDRIDQLEAQRAWRERVASLLAGDDLFLQFQPIVPLDPNAPRDPLAVEALLRIADGRTGTSEFIQAVTRYRKDVSLDLKVLGDVLDVLQVHPEISIAHNWSPRSLDPTDGLVWTLLDELQRRHIDPKRLVIEVTEHAAIDHTRRFQVAVRSLRNEGVRIALDDLGAGWSSFKFLNDTPVDIIKLDGEWTQQTTTNPIAEELVASTVRCAELTGAEVVAEWIETETQRNALRDLGVRWGQGYLLGKPTDLASCLAYSNVA